MSRQPRPRQLLRDGDNGNTQRRSREIQEGVKVALRSQDGQHPRRHRGSSIHRGDQRSPQGSGENYRGRGAYTPEPATDRRKNRE